MRTSLVLLIAAFVALIGCAAAGADPGGSVADSETLNGTVVLRLPALLPPGSLLTVTLEDVSLADAPAQTIAQTQIQVKDQQAPIQFALVYPSAAVRPGAVYAARARLNLRDQLLFTTTERYQVDALNPVPLQLVMDPVPSSPPPPPDVSLTDTYWKLLEVGGQPVAVAEQMREPQLVLNGQDGRFAGSGGVNRLMGGYTLAGNSLTFSQVASTMMAGPPEAMQQEQAIVAALGNVRGFSIAGDQLTLTDQFGQPLIRAVAVALR
ncbi:MAG: META domain-containing protein [Mycobacterium sp.]